MIADIIRYMWEQYLNFGWVDMLALFSDASPPLKEEPIYVTKDEDRGNSAGDHRMKLVKKGWCGRLIGETGEAMEDLGGPLDIEGIQVEIGGVTQMKVDVLNVDPKITGWEIVRKGKNLETKNYD